MINDKSQGSVAAHLRCGEVFSYPFTMYLVLILIVKKIKIAKYLMKLQITRLIVSCLKTKNWPDNLRMTHRETVFALVMLQCNYC